MKKASIHISYHFCIIEGFCFLYFYLYFFCYFSPTRQGVLGGWINKCVFSRLNRGRGGRRPGAIMRRRYQPKACDDAFYPRGCVGIVVVLWLRQGCTEGVGAGPPRPLLTGAAPMRL